MASSRALSPAQLEALERMVDATDIATVLAGLSYIASEKADHVLSSWQDEALAKAWMRASKALDRVSALREFSI